MTRIVFLVLLISLSFATRVTTSKQKGNDRSITADDFTRHRPKSIRSKRPPKGPNKYHLASSQLDKAFDTSSSTMVQLGVTIWKLERSTSSGEGRDRDSKWIARRTEADTQFREGDRIRLSIESPVEGYLYVVDRDWFTDGSSGETNLIFPTRGEDNQLAPGKLIDIPAESRAPFKASPKRNQAGEMLTLIVTTSPLPLSVLSGPQPVASRQLADWEGKWTALNARFEMNGGAGRTRTMEEEEAASRTGTRQLTRDDPPPQTIYYLTPKAGDGLLFNLMLSYFR